ncbi:MAG: GTPase HflX [Deltaproteobacteria bacterium]|nr:GTPase HflX [Deltaproteobacteria bacterium]
MKDVFGKTQGLKATQLRRLERLAQRSAGNKVACTPELARALAECAADTGRMVGVLADRRGNVVEVALGEPTRLYLPDVGRLRAGPGRLRGLRLVVAKPNVKSARGPLPVDHDLITDLERLKLDAVAFIEAHDDGLPGRAALATLLPDPARGPHGEQRHRVEAFAQAQDLAKVALVEIVESLEAELARKAESARTAAQVPGERDVALLVGVYSTAERGARGAAQASMDELVELAKTAGVRVADVVLQFRPTLDGKTLVGKGKLEEICLLALHQGAEVIIFDRDLSPSQLNAITDLTDLKIVDRTMLILDIFARRARSKGGKLQVELAQLQYSLPRLAKKQTGLSRLTGGIGGQGPGETKLEIDRRRAKDRIQRLTHELERYAGERERRRQPRNERDVPVIAIVGYTNAGKSTLLNRLTGADVYVADQLFATLDPTSRRLRFPTLADRVGHEVVLIDTVGFIRDLPDTLKNAFRATLEELGDADLLLHVVDASDARREQHIDAVEDVLDGLGLHDTPRLLVLNKMDQRKDDGAGEAARRGAVCVSAMTGAGLPELIERMRAQSPETKVRTSVVQARLPREPVSSSDQLLNDMPGT